MDADQILYVPQELAERLLAAKPGGVVWVSGVELAEIMIYRPPYSGPMGWYYDQLGDA